MATDQVVLVDGHDRQTGTMEKIEAHIKGVLHRAFSVFIVNSSGQLLIQKRSAGKYHSPGLWTNTCCSHPRPGEPVDHAASRRLLEEMGISCKLYSSFTFIYKAEFGNGLTEHELDHVFIGICDETPLPSPEEVDEYRYADSKELEYDMNENPGNYTVWFRIAYPRAKESIGEFLRGQGK
jgi:isopentenyl-diphosphate Delta-isomerase